MEALRTYLNNLKPTEQAQFATRCGTTIGYLRKGMSIGQRFSESIAIAMDRESGGQVSVEAMRPDVDWAYLRTGRSEAPSRERC